MNKKVNVRKHKDMLVFTAGGLLYLAPLRQISYVDWHTIRYGCIVHLSNMNYIIIDSLYLEEEKSVYMDEVNYYLFTSSLEDGKTFY